jgi:hypothetical protein
MTHSPTPTELLALKTANAALLNSPDSFCDMVATVVYALGLAQLLQSPETAAELERLRARVAELEAQSLRVRTDGLSAGDRVWHPYEMARFTVRAAAETLAAPLMFHNRTTDELESGMRVTGVDDSGEIVHVDCAPSYLWTRDDAAAELERLRTRIAELEAERHSTNEALSDAMVALSEARDRIAELEQAAVEARAALASLCYDLEDPGTAALGALHLVSRATVWTDSGRDFGALALARRDATMLRHAATFVRDTYSGEWADDAASTIETRADAVERHAPVEDPHDSPLHHRYELGRDLPAVSP